MSFVGIMFLGIAAALMAVMLKQGKNEYSVYMIVAVTVCLSFFIISGMRTILEAIEKIKTYIHFDEAYLNTLIKIVGISYLTQFSTDLCKDCGYQALSNQLQIFGKISVLAVSMPVILSLLETINQVLG
ncbi:MAG: SpoIIIAC/SpoIIIAD family protein [Lachnospiraceae bacterium]|nr:SpoIIIAC/SpoIIIAD family protein [Lachnospiraceae bacterium]